LEESPQTVALETRFKAYTVWLILNGKTEEALERLAEHYDVDVPKLKTGLPKRHKTGVLGCYTTRDKTISVLNSDMMSQPSVIIHEFYHHLRTGVDHKHRGNERNAREFAQDFTEAYKTMISSSGGSS
jgi:hypothetical protein